MPWGETIIYETHVRGMTMRHPGVPEHAARHLRRPRPSGGHRPPASSSASPRSSCCRSTPSSRTGTCSPQGLANYWGYNTIGFFAPEPRYLAGGAIGEFKTMVKRFHDAGIEVILDVVYNHTAEGNHLGPTLSFRGIDNATYYRLMPDNPRLYVDDTGCGNTLNMSHPRVLQLVIDSLRYWVERDARRRLPLRPRHDARARGATASIPTAASSTRSGRTRCWAASS